MNIKDNIIKESEYGSLRDKNNKGGQSVGLINSRVFLKSEETDFYIEVGYYRSQIKNIELAKTLFSLYLDEIIKE